MVEIYSNYCIQLIKSAILNTATLPLPKEVDLNKLFEFSKMHSIENIVYQSLSKLNIDNKEIMAEFEQSNNQAIMLDTIQQYYLEIISDEFEKNHIRYCIMKGPVIKKLYPSTDMRKSGDLDIFVDDENTEKVREIMENIGFRTKLFDKSVAHDEYLIDRIVEVEIHRQLISNKCPWDKKCQNIVDRLVRTDGFEYQYEMTIEDYYLYMIGHMAKHMKYSGIGIKMFLDIWVYLNRYQNEINWQILKKHLKECGLDIFEDNVRKLCDFWFKDKKDVSTQIEIMSKYVALSGNFGTYDQLVAGEMAANALNTNSQAVSKIKYYIGLFFMPYKLMCTKYPVLHKCPVLLPFLWVHRAFKTVIFNKQKADVIRNRYNNVDIDYGKNLLEFKKNIGL